MKKKLHTLRFAYDNWRTEERFLKFLPILEKYRDCFDEISLFTASTHAPLPIEENRARTEIIKKRIETLRLHGFSVGINHLATIGHHEEDLGYALHGNYNHMMNIDGAESKGTFCMNDTRYINDYVRPVYAMLAKANPEHIWIDDDVRYYHWPIGFGCFCDICIDKFNKKHNTNFNRETLKKNLKCENIELRKAWLNQNSETLCNLFKVIADTVYSINPNIRLGFMTGERYMEGYQFANYADALSQGGKHEIMWRPGGGAYTDYNFNEIIWKCEEIGRQTAYLPDYVTLKQSELESFPYHLIKKTPTSTVLESLWAMASGATGTAFNIVPDSLEPVETIVPYFSAIQKALPFYRLLQEKIAGKKSVGIHTGWHIDAQAAVPGDFFELFGNMYATHAQEIFEFGLPQCYKEENAKVTCITGKSVATWSDEKIENLLSGGVYLDTSALEYLNERGFGKLTGFRRGKSIPVDAHEEYLPHFINEGIVGAVRNARQAFNVGDSFEVISTNDKTETLSALYDYHHQLLASCSLGIFENEKGGRICVSGYYSHTWVCDYNKTMQLKRIMRYLAREDLPSYVDSYQRIRNHTFIENGHIYVALCNPTNECWKHVRIAVKTKKDCAVYYSQDTTAHSVVLKESIENGYHVFEIEEILPYQMGLLEIE